MSDLLDLYKSRCSYKVLDTIQELDFNFDLSKLKIEILKFIVNNKFGFKSTLLRLPVGETDYTASKDEIEVTGVSVYDYERTNAFLDIQKINSAHNKSYSEWHPDLTNSYVREITAQLEKFTGLKIGKIRLNWLLPDTGYTMHIDVEPMRIHIPLLTNDAVYYIHDHQLYTMKYGKIYHLITSEHHTVWNFGKLPRLHLIFNTYDDDDLDQKINKFADSAYLQQNFIDHINSNLDQKTLNFLLQIYLTHSKNNPEQTLRDIKLINDLLCNNKTIN